MRKDKLPQQEGITRTPFPSSKKIYVPGRIHPQIKVAMREISLSPTKIQATGELEENPPVTVYDTSGPYTDPNVNIDINKGLQALRQQWILDRQDVEELEGISSNYGQERLAKSDIDWLRFPNLRKPLRAKKGQNVSQMHYAKKASLPQKWSISLSAKTKEEPNSCNKASTLANNIPDIALAPISPKGLLPQNLSEKRWPEAAPLSPLILTTPN